LRHELVNIFGQLCARMIDLSHKHTYIILPGISGHVFCFVQGTRFDRA